MINRRGQVTIFIIIAVILIIGIVLFFTLRNSISVEEIPTNLEPVYNNFLSCLEDESFLGIKFLESQAGYIELPEFEPGSGYMPFSSQLDFVGNAVPYWYYVSGNNFPKEQVPSQEEMEKQLAEFIDSRILDCDYSSYYSQGFEINQGEPKSSVSLKEGKVEVSTDLDFNVEKAGENVLVKTHKIEINSNLFGLYNSAKEIYEKEQSELFLEKYAVDNLRLYAPVDGVELSCSPLVFGADQVFSDLENAIEVNTLALKIKGGEYELSSDENKYFILDIDSPYEVRFLNSKSWAHSFEVNPSEGNVLIANPVGNQQGLGILGFCYVPYHYVYDVKYPVLIQVSSGDEIFQFPMAIILDNNNPRETLDSSAIGVTPSEFCNYKNTEFSVNVYDSELNLLPADVSYECFGEVCEIGATVNGNLIANFPQCVNGYLIAKSEGFKETKYMVSSVESGSVDIILDKIYDIEIDLNLGGKDYSGDAIINFVSGDSSKTISYPGQKNVELSEGQYEVSVYIYKNSSLELGATTSRQCTTVTKSGIGGLLGLTEEKCFDVEVPAQIVSNALAGGGKKESYFLESTLESSKIVVIDAESLSVPKTLEQLQDNYLLFDEKELNVYFR